jgi:hypothetical protein
MIRESILIFVVPFLYELLYHLMLGSLEVLIWFLQEVNPIAENNDWKNNVKEDADHSPELELVLWQLPEFDLVAYELVQLEVVVLDLLRQWRTCCGRIHLENSFLVLKPLLPLYVQLNHLKIEPIKSPVVLFFSDNLAHLFLDMPI